MKGYQYYMLPVFCIDSKNFQYALH